MERKTYYVTGISFSFMLVLITVMLFVSPLSARELNLKYDLIGSEEGLSQNTIFSVFQDHQGFLWFGTEAGLNKYNGYDVTVYMPDPKDIYSLSNNYIYCIYEDSHKELWVGTDNGLNRFDRRLNRFYNYFFDPDDPLSLISNRVYCIFEDRFGLLWIGTDRGLCRFDRTQEEFSRYSVDENEPSSISNNVIRTVFEDRSGILWIGTDHGLNRFDRENRSFYRYHHQPDEPFSISDDRIRAIFEDTDRNLWIGTLAGGLNVLDRDKNQFTAFRPDPNDPRSISDGQINALWEDSLGRLWIATHEGGLNRYHKNGNDFSHIINFPIGDAEQTISRFLSIYEDRSGILWLGTYGAGALKINIESEKFYHYKSDPRNANSLSHPYVRSFFEDKRNILWAGTDGGGLNRIDRRRGEYTFFRHDPDDPFSISSNRIFFIFEDRDSFLWIGTYGGGLDRFDTRRNRFDHFRADPGNPASLSDDRIRTVFMENNDLFWIGTDGSGLNRFDRPAAAFTRYPYDVEDGTGLSNGRIFFITQNHLDKTLLICTFGGGLNIFDPRTEKFTYLKNDPHDPASISNDYVLCAHQSSNGIIWIGSNGGGLTRIDLKANQFKTYTEADGLCNNAVYGILEDKQGFLWMSSNKGISRFNPKLEKFKNYDVSDGLQGNEFNGNSYYMSPRGEMFFGGINGFSSFMPEKVRDNPHIPPVVITDFQLFNESVPVSDESGSILKQDISFLDSITLSHRHKVFSFEFAALHYVYPEKNEFRYRMIPFDQDWIKTSSQKRFATYTNLDPGEYIFHVQAANNDGIWNEEGAKLKITIVPPFTRTLIFKILVGIFIALLTILFYSNRTRKMRQQQKKLEHLVTERTADLENEIIEREQAQEEMKKARDEADAANQAKSMFLARMSHEIRTPMNSVIGFSDMLIETKLNDEQSEYVRNISKSGDALLSLISEILDFSMIEAGQMALQPIDFDLEVTAFDICHLIQPRLGNKPVEILCRIGDQVPAYIKGDAGRIRQILINLMANAVKFTHEGEIELAVDVDEQTDKRLKLHMRVRDTGIGIPPDKYDMIFEVFQQADGSTTRKYGGTGLGLAISRQIARLHEGDIWVESEVDKGSTFHFTAWVEESSKKIDKKPPTDALKGKRAVIVDDNVNNLSILDHVLNIYGMNSISLNKGDRLIQTLEEELSNGRVVHICILDIQMPEISGYDVAKKIRKHKDNRISQIPLLAFSSSTSRKSRMYRESGFDGFLPKPIQRQKLITMIKRLLGEKTKGGGDPDKKMTITQHSIVEDAKHSIKILLAEDNPLNQKLAKFMLSKGGYQLDVVETGIDAVKTFSSNPDEYDLIFMDIHMPEMDGLAATRKLREMGFSDIPIIAMTADAMKEDRDKCLSAGMNDYIAKPIKREVVFNMVRKWVLESNR